MTKIINDGYSIIYARKIICGGNKSIKTQAVMKHPLYLHVLNQYMKDRCYNKTFYYHITSLKQGPLQDPNKRIIVTQELHEERG